MPRILVGLVRYGDRERCNQIVAELPKRFSVTASMDGSDDFADVTVEVGDKQGREVAERGRTRG